MTTRGVDDDDFEAFALEFVDTLTGDDNRIRLSIAIPSFTGSSQEEREGERTCQRRVSAL